MSDSGTPADQPELLTADRQIASLLDLLPGPVTVVDESGVCETANLTFQDMVGIDRESIVGQPLTDRVAPEDRALAEAALREARTEGRASTEVRITGSDGHYRTCDVRLTYDASSRRSIAIATDLTPERERQVALLRETKTDPLTGLANRSQLTDVISDAIAAGEAAGMVVALLDLDRFKSINDTLGHHLGDHMLAIIGARLSRLLPEAVIGRLGGDEFVLVMPPEMDITADSASDVIAAAFVDPVQLGLRLIPVQASIGVVVAEGDETASELLQQADIAAYEAKRAGRNRAVVASRQLLDSVRSAIQLEEELRAALRARQFVPWFQPVVSVETGAVTGFESLMRWQRPGGVVVAAAEFIDVASDTGLLADISDEVRRRTIATAGETDSALLFGINLSGQEVLDEETPDRIVDLCERSGVAFERIVIEITEQTLIADLDSATGTIGSLHDRGFQVSLDDFGTGHSSLNYLTRLPLTAVKLGGEFIANARAGDRGQETLAAIFDFLSRLGHEVVFEGVETTEDHEMVRSVGGLYAQGWHYGFPAPIDEALKATPNLV